MQVQTETAFQHAFAPLFDMTLGHHSCGARNLLRVDKGRNMTAIEKILLFLEGAVSWPSRHGNIERLRCFADSLTWLCHAIALHSGILQV